MGRQIALFLVEEATLYDHIKLAQRIYRLINDRHFESTLDNLSEKEYNILIQYIRSYDYEAIKKFKTKLFATGLDTLPFRTLRQLARSKQVPNYCRMSKDALICAIRKREQEQDEL